MTERLLQLLIMRAGPQLAKLLAAAIINALRQLAAGTETDADDLLVKWIADKLEDFDLLETPE